MVLTEQSGGRYIDGSKKKNKIWKEYYFSFLNLFSFSCRGVMLSDVRGDFFLAVGMLSDMIERNQRMNRRVIFPYFAVGC